MENNIYGVVYSPLDKEPLPEVGKTRLAEYKAIRPLIPHDLAQPARLESRLFI